MGALILGPRSRRVAVCVSFACAAATIAIPVPARAQGPAQNVVLIVTDGLRWQELFDGADTAYISRGMGGVGDTAGVRQAWSRPTAVERRRLMMPFFWDSIATKGSVWGDPSVGSSAVVTNGKNFSYPGYNEMLTGRADPRIDSNNFGPNPNVTVFEWLASRPGFQGRVSAFATWGVFDAIFNKERARHVVYSGMTPPAASQIGTPDPTLDRLYATTTRIWGDNSLDAFTQAAVVNHVKAKKPRVLFVGYGETDEWAHSRRYDLVLRSARSVDAFIAELWQTIQAIPEYRGRTTFIVTTDHGRGDGYRWVEHGEDVPGAERMWIAAMGPGVPAAGIVRGTAVTQSQIAATVASLLGEDVAKFDVRAARTLIP